MHEASRKSREILDFLDAYGGRAVRNRKPDKLIYDVVKAVCDNRVYLLYDKGRLVFFAKWIFKKDTLKIEGVVVHPDYRYKDILWKALYDELPRHDVKYVSWDRDDKYENRKPRKYRVSSILRRAK